MKQFLLLASLLWLLAACTETKPETPADSLKGDSVTNTAGQSVWLQSDTSRTARKQNDCSILRKRVVTDATGKRLLADLRLMTACGLDSFDFVYVVPNLALDYITFQQQTGNDSLTYGDVLKHIKEFKTSGTYTQLKQQVMTLDSLRSVRFERKNMDKMKPVMGRLGFTEPEWLAFTKFAATYPLPKERAMSWGEMLEAFDDDLAKSEK
ncbi:MAG: hypothetical protein MUC87_04325 [Bacteroidia bacterium]|jgi:hypothetical protein|nr:hypothetical protein [Bacteroidia bacterium]